MTSYGPDGPRTIEDEQVTALLKRTLSRKPASARTGRSAKRPVPAVFPNRPSTVCFRPSRCSPIARAQSNSPRIRSSSKKVRDIAGLYLNPPEHALVLCVDEKSQIQARNRTQPVLPMGLGYVEGVTHDYVHHGTTT